MLILKGLAVDIIPAEVGCSWCVRAREALAARSSVVGIQSQPVEPTKRFRSGVSISIIHELQKLTLCGPPRAADQPACFRGRSFHVACNFDLASPSRWY